MADFTVELDTVLKEHLYCRECGEWVYTPEMNMMYKDENGNDYEHVGEGCLKKDEKGSYIECPSCKSRYYLE